MSSNTYCLEGDGSFDVAKYEGGVGGGSEQRGGGPFGYRGERVYKAC